MVLFESYMFTQINMCIIIHTIRGYNARYTSILSYLMNDHLGAVFHDDNFRFLILRA